MLWIVSFLATCVSFFAGYLLGKNIILKRWHEEQFESEKEFSRSISKWQTDRDKLRKSYETVIRRMSKTSLEPADIGKLLSHYLGEEDAKTVTSNPSGG